MEDDAGNAPGLSRSPRHQGLPLRCGWEGRDWAAKERDLRLSARYLGVVASVQPSLCQAQLHIHTGAQQDSGGDRGCVGGCPDLEPHRAGNTDASYREIVTAFAAVLLHRAFFLPSHLSYYIVCSTDCKY